MDVSLEQKHQRLFEVRRLQVDHAAIENRTGDRPAHHEHNIRMRAPIKALRQHIARLRRE